jgi:hypothetical protein
MKINQFIRVLTAIVKHEIGGGMGDEPASALPEAKCLKSWINSFLPFIRAARRVKTQWEPAPRAGDGSNGLTNAPYHTVLKRTRR